MLLSGPVVFKAGACIATLIAAVIQYARYRTARRSGVSRDEYILARAGGADKLAKKALTARRMAIFMMLAPLLVIAIPLIFLQVTIPNFASLIVLFLVLEIFFVPLGLLLIWDSRKAMTIACAAQQTDHST